MNGAVLLGFGLVIIGVVVTGLLIAELRKGDGAAPRPLPRRDLDLSAYRDTLLAYRQRLRQAIRAHPLPALGWIEVLFWALWLITAIDHVRAPRASLTGQAVWALTIGPHELGHLICAPFGTFIMFAGGSIWQVLWWFGLGAVTLWLRRQITATLILWAITGHSFINLAVYIGDARAKQLPLLFGMSSDHHDWANLLGMTNLLPLDTTLAALVALAGIGIVVAAAGIGMAAAWFLPRPRLGNIKRFVGSPLRALVDGVTGRQWVIKVEPRS
jgi:hypothetical protein